MHSSFIPTIQNDDTNNNHYIVLSDTIHSDAIFDFECKDDTEKTENNFYFYNYIYISHIDNLHNRTNTISINYNIKPLIKYSPWSKGTVS
jgi:hypothetical protein